MKQLLIFLTVSVLMVGCGKQQNVDEEIRCTCPPIVILQPTSEFSTKEVKALVPRLNDFINESLGYELEIEVSSPVKLDDSMKNDNGIGYSANKIISRLGDSSHNAIIVVTHHDVSYADENVPERVGCGLSFKGKQVCVASDFRLKNKKRDFWKVVAHELSHSFFSLQHCVNNDPQCVAHETNMQNISGMKHLCDDCKSKIRIK